MRTEANPNAPSEMMMDLARARAGGNEVEDTGVLPVGEKTVEASAPQAEVSEVEETAPTPVVEEIRIGDKVFTSQAEAIKYAESLETEKLVNEAYNTGVKEALHARAPIVETPPEEDKFEEKFYTDPKGTLKDLKEQAKQEALQTIRAEQKREQLWSEFLGKHPDIDREDAEIILRKPENWETIGKMVDEKKAMDLLAQKVRADYQRKAERLKPRTELPNRQTPVQGSGNSTSSGVTPSKKSSEPQSFVAQFKSLRRG